MEVYLKRRNITVHVPSDNPLLVAYEEAALRARAVDGAYPHVTSAADVRSSARRAEEAWRKLIESL